MKYIQTYEVRKFGKIEGDTYILNMLNLRLPKELKKFSISLYKILKNFAPNDYVIMHEIGNIKNDILVGKIIGIKIEEKLTGRPYLNINVANSEDTQSVYFNYFLNIKNKIISDAILYTVSELNLSVTDSSNYITIGITYDKITQTLKSLTENLKMMNTTNKFNL